MVAEIKHKVLITGSDGMLGTALVDELSANFAVIGTTIKDLDITNSRKVKQVILENKPWLVINTAALTDVDGCEDTPELAYNVNALGTKNIAQASKEVGAILIQISTDYIFDGETDKPYSEDSSPNPISVYGRTKFEGERFLAKELNRFIIVRSSWLFGKGKIGFIEKIIAQARAKKEISVVADKYGCPTYVKDLAIEILRILKLIKNNNLSPQKEIFHITNSGFCSWIEYAKMIIDIAKIEGVVLKPIKSEEFKFKAKRPKFSVLDNSRYNKLTGEPLRSWQEALKEYLQCLEN